MAKIEDVNAPVPERHSKCCFRKPQCCCKHDWVAYLVQVVTVLGFAFFILEIIGFFLDLDPKKNYPFLLPGIIVFVILGVIIRSYLPDKVVREFEDAIGKLPTVNVFVSFDRSDKKTELQVEGRLQEKASGSTKIEFFLSPLLPNQANFESVSKLAIDKADLVVIIASRAYLTQEYCRAEYEYAMERAVAGYSDIIRIATEKDVNLDTADDIESPSTTSMRSKRNLHSIDDQVDFFRGDNQTLNESMRKVRVIAEKKKGSLKECLHDIYRAAPIALTRMIKDIENLADSVPNFGKGATNKNRQNFHRVNSMDEKITSSTAGSLRKSIQNLIDPSEPLEFDQITRFWNTKPELLYHGRIVKITGTVSTYAPVVWGPPMMKRDAHLNFRTSAGAVAESSLNTLLTFSAGQMVWVLDLPQRPSNQDQDEGPLNDKSASLLMRNNHSTAREMLKGTFGTDNIDEDSFDGGVHLDAVAGRSIKKRDRYLGLYQGIVRNSIPLYVDGDYYDTVVEPMFTNRTKSKTFEGTITGRICLLPDNTSALSRMERWAAGWESDRRVPICQEGELPVYGIYIGFDDQTGIEKVGEANYLDGDVWVAVEDKDGKESMVSRFGDLSNERDTRKMIRQMKKEIRQNNLKVKFQFDQVDKPFGHQGFDESDFCQAYLMGGNDGGDDESDTFSFDSNDDSYIG